MQELSSCCHPEERGDEESTISPPAGEEILERGVSCYLKACRRVEAPFMVRQAHHERPSTTLSQQSKGP